MNKEQGFILKPETYNQKEWYELFMNLSKEYRKKCNIINELEEYLIEHIDEYREMEQDAMFEFGLVLDKLKELKENNKDE